jgi:hypothetical protein
VKRFIRCARGHYRDENTKVCMECEKMNKQSLYCPHCGVMVDGGARYCSNCRSPIEARRRWMGSNGLTARLSPEEILVRTDIDAPLKGRIEFHVKEGEEGLLLAGGMHLADMGPGRYAPDWFLGKLKGGDQPVTLVLVRKGPMDLVFNPEGIRTNDPVKIDATVTLVVEVMTPILFFENAARGSARFGVSDLHAFLADAVGSAFGDLLGKRSIKELEGDRADPKLKGNLEVLLEHQLKTTLETSGLYLSQLKAVEYDFRNYHRVKDVEEEGFIRNEKDEAEARELEKRIEIRRKTLDLVGDLSLSDEKIEEFLLEEEKGKLLRDQELKDIKTALEEREIDRKTKRQWITRKLELDQELDYERRRLLGKSGVEREILEARFAVIEVEAKLEKIRLENELQDQKTKAIAEIEINELKEESSLRIMRGMVELKAKKDRDAIENELFREKERLEIRLREKEREAKN